MKYWLLKTFFNKEWDSALAESKRQGSIDAFEKAREDVLATIKEDTDEKADKLADERLASFLSNFDPKSIMTVNPLTKGILIGGEKIDEARASNLKAEAQFFVESDLWKIVYETPKALAEKAMFMDDGKLDTQLLKGRCILFMLATQKKIVDVFTNYVIPNSPPH